MSRTDNTLVIANALFEKKTAVVVASTGGDYTTLTSAYNAGYDNIYVKAGTYSEPSNITIRRPNVKIVGENKYNTKIVFPNGSDGLRLFDNSAYIAGLYLDTYTNTGASALVIGDGSTPGTPDYTKGNYNTVEGCYIRGTDVYGAFSLYVAGDSYLATYSASITFGLNDLAFYGGNKWKSLQAGNTNNTPIEGAFWTDLGVTTAGTVQNFDANTMAIGNVVKNCTIEGYQTGDVAVFALQKQGQFINNTVIGGRLAYYMVRDCICDFTSLDSLAEGVFFAGPSQNNVLKANIVRAVNNGMKAQNQVEHTVTYPTYAIRNNTIDVVVYDCGRHAINLINCDNNTITGNIDGADYHGVYLNNSKQNNFPTLVIKDPRNAVANTLGSGIYFTANSLDNNFGDVTIIETKVADYMYSAVCQKEDSTCTGNKFNNLTVRGLNGQRTLWIQSKGWQVVNADLEGGTYNAIYCVGATYCQFDNIRTKNNTNSANNTYAEILFTSNSTNNVIGKIITESTAANKAKYGVQFDAGSNNNSVLNHQNIGAVTSAELNSGTGNSIGVTITGMTVRNVIQQNLASNFNAATGVVEEEVTGLRLTLPIISGTCTVKITSKVYINTKAGNNSMRIRTGSDLAVLTNNTQQDNGYVGGAKTLETYTAVVVASLDLSTQKYVFYSVQNDVDALNLSLSASGARSTLVAEVYK